MGIFGGGTASVKATIHCLDNADWSVAAQFNPTSFKYTRATEWTLEQSIGFSHAWQRMAFKTGKIDELDVTLLFDESEDTSATTAGDFIPNLAALAPPSMQGALPASMQAEPTKDDALKLVGMLHNLTLPVNFGDAAKPQIRPPAVAFVWGKFEFQGFITSLSNEVLLFDEAGGARRVKSTLKFQGHAMGRAETIDDLMDATYTAPVETAGGGISAATAGDREGILADLLK
ncbi:MAG: hypothetical protein ACI9VR_005336 [Cognaticolwellia sp.]|jgi:hypothetical protein